MSNRRDVVSMAGETVPLIGPDTDPPVSRRSRSQVAAEAVLAIPNLIKLCARLLKDPRVPRRSKAMLGVAGLYFASPIDLIPEILFPVLGQVDDMLVIAFAVHRLLDAVDPEVLAEYWDGEPDALELVAALVAWGAGLLPRPVRRLLS
jgi:uncharacterized membrane protein YkvA (DUF1232 family)